jgi:DNA anti-recombination protein RmuC
MYRKVLVLAEIRDLRREAREDRRHADASAQSDRRHAEADRCQAEADRRRSDERFEGLLLDFRQDSARREAAMQKILEATQAAFRDLRTVGQSIVKTLNRHTKILERHTGLLEGIDRKLGARSNGRRGHGRGRA